MRPGSANKFIQERLFECVCLCDSVYEVYNRYCESNHRADTGSTFSSHIDSIFPRCWHSIRGLTTIPVPPPVPSKTESIEQKAHRVDELRRWAISNNDTQVLAIDVVIAIEKVSRLVSRAYQELPASVRSSSLLEKFFGGIDRRLGKLIEACKYAEISYTKKASGGVGRTEIIYELRKVYDLAVEHRKQLASYHISDDAARNSNWTFETDDSDSEFYWREIFDPGSRTFRYRSFVNFADKLDSELTGISRQAKRARRKNAATPEDERRIHELIESNPETPIKTLRAQVNKAIDEGKYDKKDHFTTDNGIRDAAKRHAKRLGADAIKMR